MTQPPLDTSATSSGRSPPASPQAAAKDSDPRRRIPKPATSVENRTHPSCSAAASSRPRQLRQTRPSSASLQFYNPGPRQDPRPRRVRRHRREATIEPWGSIHPRHAASRQRGGVLIAFTGDRTARAPASRKCIGDAASSPVSSRSAVAVIIGLIVDHHRRRVQIEWCQGSTSASRPRLGHRPGPPNLLTKASTNASPVAGPAAGRTATGAEQ